MLSFFIQIIQTALDELEIEPSDITEVEIEPYSGESYWLNFNNGGYYSCVTMAYGKLVVWISGNYPKPVFW